MPNYVVQSAIQKKTLDGKHGPMQVISLVLQEYGQSTSVNAEWFTKASTPLPEAGSQLEGEVKPGQYGNDFKKAATGFGGGGGGRSKPPEERRSIAMQHAQKCAVTILQVAAEHGDYKPPNAGDVVGQVKTVAAALFDQVMDAEGAQR